MDEIARDKDYADIVPTPDRIEVRPIAVVHSPFRQRHGTPRQPGFSDGPEVDVTIELLPHIDLLALQDLASFDRIWLIAWFHLNGPRLKPLVKTPRGGEKRGVLATRAPHRPNPIGLSCVELVGIKGRTLTVRGADLIDGTPILDIKPYIADYDALPEASRGWLDEQPDEPEEPHDLTS